MASSSRPATRRRRRAPRPAWRLAVRVELRPDRRRRSAAAARPAAGDVAQHRARAARVRSSASTSSSPRRAATATRASRLRDQPLAAGGERRHVAGAQPVVDRLLEPERVRVAARREAPVREQQHAAASIRTASSAAPAAARPPGPARSRRRRPRPGTCPARPGSPAARVLRHVGLADRRVSPTATAARLAARAAATPALERACETTRTSAAPQPAAAGEHRPPEHRLRASGSTRSRRRSAPTRSRRP